MRREYNRTGDEPTSPWLRVRLCRARVQGRRYKRGGVSVMVKERTGWVVVAWFTNENDAIDRMWREVAIMRIHDELDGDDE